MDGPMIESEQMALATPDGDHPEDILPIVTYLRAPH